MYVFPALYKTRIIHTAVISGWKLKQGVIAETR